ncbi:MAG: immunoglobulin domain-containing protein [Bacteroidota bacterium]
MHLLLSSRNPVISQSAKGLSASFSITAIGTGLTYQWRNATTELTDGTNISGATSTTLILGSLTMADAGNYNCIVSGTCGQVVSANATLTVGSLPTIASQPIGDTKKSDSR